MALARTFSNGGKYQKFEFRGEGCSSFVIGATRVFDGQKVVWRFRKEKKMRVLSAKSDASSLQRYMKTVVGPLLGRQFVAIPELIAFDVADLRFLAERPGLRDYFPMDAFPVLALEMPDFTTLPAALPSTIPTVTVEIKPKQAFLSPPPFPAAPYCRNCLCQLLKWQNGRYMEMYDFCPLDLFSGSLERTLRALEALVRVPHHNLRISCDGELVHSEDFRLDRASLESLVCPTASLEDFLELLARILTGSLDLEQPFGLYKDSILGRLQQAQKLDSLGIWNAFEVLKSLPPELMTELKDPYFLFETSKKLLTSSDTGPLKLLKAYLITATLHDCSVLISFRQVSLEQALDLEAKAVKDKCGSRILRLKSHLCFYFNVSVVDLDAKSAKKIEGTRQRLLDAFQFLGDYAQDFGAFRRSCEGSVN